MHKIIFSFTLGGHVYLEGLGDCAIQSSYIVILEMNAEVGECNFLSSYTVHVQYASQKSSHFSKHATVQRLFCVPCSFSFRFTIFRVFIAVSAF